VHPYNYIGFAGILVYNPFKGERPNIIMRKRPKKTKKQAVPRKQIPSPGTVKSVNYGFFFIASAVFLAFGIGTNMPVFYLLCVLSLIAGLVVKNRQIKRR
jgi:hypothetical protein